MFVSDFLGSDNEFSRLAAIDDGTTPLAVYALFSTITNSTKSLLLYNSVLYNGTATRLTSIVSISNLPRFTDIMHAKRLTASSAEALTGVTIGGSYGFGVECRPTGSQILETISVLNGAANVSVGASEAVILYL